MKPTVWRVEDRVVIFRERPKETNDGNKTHSTTPCATSRVLSFRTRLFVAACRFQVTILKP